MIHGQIDSSCSGSANAVALACSALKNIYCSICKLAFLLMAYRSFSHIINGPENYQERERLMASLLDLHKVRSYDIFQ